MTEFRVGDKVQVEMPRGYSKRGVLGISVMFTTSPEARFESAVGTIKEINPIGPHSVHQYLVDFRPFDNSRLGIPWQAHWFREEWISLVERPTGEDLPPTPPGPRGGAEDSVGPYAKGASPGGDDRTPEQAAQERERLAEPKAVAETRPGSGTDPADPEPTTANDNTGFEIVSGMQHAGDVFSAGSAAGAVEAGGARSEAIPFETDEPRVDFELDDAVGGDRVGTGTGFLTLPDEPRVEITSTADSDDMDVPGGVLAFASDSPAGSDASPDPSADSAQTWEVSATGEFDREAAAGSAGDAEIGVAGMTGDGTPIGVTGTLPEPNVDEVVEVSSDVDASLAKADSESEGEAFAALEHDAQDAGFGAMAAAGMSIAAAETGGAGEEDAEVIPGGAVEASELGAATNAAVLAAPAATTSQPESESAADGYVRVAGERDCPPGYPIKGNASSKIFHLPGQSSYDVTIPEICFASAEDAVSAGFRPRKGAAGAREASSAFAGMGSGPTDDDHDLRLGVPIADGESASASTTASLPSSAVAMDVVAGGSAAGGVDVSAGHALDDPGAIEEWHASIPAPSASPYDDGDGETAAASSEAESSLRSDAGSDGSEDGPMDIDTTGMSFADALAAGARSGDGWVRGDGTKYCPEAFPIKGNANSMIYHRPSDDSYRPTIPEVCFASDDDAEASGFRPRSGARSSHPQRKDKTKHRR